MTSSEQAELVRLLKKGAMWPAARLGDQKRNSGHTRTPLTLPKAPFHVSKKNLPGSLCH